MHCLGWSFDSWNPWALWIRPRCWLESSEFYLPGRELFGARWRYLHPWNLTGRYQKMAIILKRSHLFQGPSFWVSSRWLVGVVFYTFLREFVFFSRNGDSTYSTKVNWEEMFYLLICYDSVFVGVDMFAGISWTMLKYIFVWHISCINPSSNHSM